MSKMAAPKMNMWRPGWVWVETCFEWPNFIYILYILFGGFLNLRYPQMIQHLPPFNYWNHLKPMVLGIPILGPTICIYIYIYIYIFIYYIYLFISIRVQIPGYVFAQLYKRVNRWCTRITSISTAPSGLKMMTIWPYATSPYVIFLGVPPKNTVSFKDV